MTRHTALLSLVVVVAAGGLDACRKKPEPAPVPTTVTTSDDGTSRRRADAAAALAQRRADSLAAARAAAEEGTQTALRRILTQTVYFDYDKDVLRDDTRGVLDAKAAVFNANRAITVVITGHTDEQGTSEYNLALGQRRAAQVKRYLASKGVAENRLTTQSMGDAQPAVQGSDESAYQMNRRAEFAPQNTPALLMPPRP